MDAPAIESLSPRARADALPARSPLLRPLLLVAGWSATALGVAGIFVPFLPTVPFLLLAAACFARSSRRAHRWLLTHPRLGPLVRDYLDGRGVPARSRAWAIALLWTSIGLSVLLAAPPAHVKGILVAVACGVTLYLISLPTRR